MLTRDRIKLERPTETLHVPEWGGEVCLQVITGAQRDEIVRRAVAQETDEGIRAVLISMCVVDPSTREPMFSSDEVQAFSAVTIMRLFQACERMNGLSEESQAAILGNSNGTTSGSSGTSLPSGSEVPSPD